MSILKIEAHERYTLKGMLDYIQDKKKHDNEIVYYNTCYSSTAFPLISMLVTKQLYNKCTGIQYKQIILSLETEESLQNNYNQYIKATYEIASLLANILHCQIAYAIHANTDNLHTHFIVNSVRFDNGHKLQIGTNELILIKRKINEILSIHNLSLIKC